MKIANYYNYQAVLDSQISLPKSLLVEYRSLGIAEKELVTILQIHQYHLDGNSFPTRGDCWSNFLLGRRMFEHFTKPDSETITFY
ncbi:hypothetical protein [Halobacillus andaensis]|uniref:hypothetical protein n=1 Tax=Halobacillus andaensis TaxID=1176239 RepID=UPI003D73632F